MAQADVANGHGSRGLKTTTCGRNKLHRMSRGTATVNRKPHSSHSRLKCCPTPPHFFLIESPTPEDTDSQSAPLIRPAARLSTPHLDLLATRRHHSQPARSPHTALSGHGQWIALQMLCAGWQAGGPASSHCSSGWPCLTSASGSIHSAPPQWRYRTKGQLTAHVLYSTLGSVPIDRQNFDRRLTTARLTRHLPAPLFRS